MMNFDLASACGPVTVNGVTISIEAIAAEAQNHPAPKGKPGWALKAAARALALREVLLQEAQARQIVPLPIELAAGQWETEEEAQIRQLLESTISPVKTDELKLRAIYDETPERFRAPSLFEAAHILFPAAPDDPENRLTAQANAQAVLNMLQDDPSRFPVLAAEHSACNSRENGGLLGQITSGDTVPEFEAAMRRMKVGAISEMPVESRYGFHLIRLDGYQQGEVLPFSVVLPRLRAAQEKAEWLRSSRAYVEKLAACAKVNGLDLTAAVGES